MLNSWYRFCEKRKKRKRLQEIDKEFKKERLVLKKTIQVLLLGIGESGKSTILKQMRIIHISKFSEQERLEKVNDIKSNIRDSVLSILDEMERLQIAFDDPTLVEARKYVYENIDLIFTKPSPPNLTQNQQSHSDIIAHVTRSINNLDITSSANVNSSSFSTNQKYVVFPFRL